MSLTDRSLTNQAHPHRVVINSKNEDLMTTDQLCDQQGNAVLAHGLAQSGLLGNPKWPVHTAGHSEVPVMWGKGSALGKRVLKSL